MKWFLSTRLIMTLICILLPPLIQAAPDNVTSEQSASFLSKGKKITFISAGNYSGIEDSKDINISNLSFGKAYYVTDGLGLYGEVLAMATQGERDGIDADVEGIGAFFALRWHFIRMKNWSLFLNHGIGPLLFFEEFPPGGTKLNGLTQYGVGMKIRISNSKFINLGVRHIHISNGKGFVDDNPSYDGHGAYLELAQHF